jgi:hypothetical protein
MFPMLEILLFWVNFSVGQQPNSVLGRLIVEFSRIHRHTTFGTTPLDEGSARLRSRYIHDTQQAQQTNIPSLSWIRTRRASIQAAADLCLRPVFFNPRAAARYRALASIIPGREKPEETTICYKISLVQLITNLNVIIYLSTCHTVYISVLMLLMIMT